MLALALNSDLFRYGLLLITAPLWIPFLKALWEEFNDSLREEGGLLGFALTEAELERMNRQKGSFESPLVHEPWDAPARPAGSSRVRQPVQAPTRPGFRESGTSDRSGGFRPGGR